MQELLFITWLKTVAYVNNCKLFFRLAPALCVVIVIDAVFVVVLLNWNVNHNGES